LVEKRSGYVDTKWGIALPDAVFARRQELLAIVFGSEPVAMITTQAAISRIFEESM